MHFNASTEYPASAAAVAELFANPDFVDAKIVASGASEGKKEITGSPAGAFSVATTRTMPSDIIPAQYRKFVPGGVTLTLTEAWGAPTADGSREGKLTLKIAGVPASAEGTCTLTAVSEEVATLTYDGDVNVSIPLFGGKIERAAVNAVERVMRLERDVAVEWLARR